MPAYLDYCASAPLDERVLREMTKVFSENFGNADSRTHLYGTTAKELVEK